MAGGAFRLKRRLPPVYGPIHSIIDIESHLKRLSLPRAERVVRGESGSELSLMMTIASQETMGLVTMQARNTDRYINIAGTVLARILPLYSYYRGSKIILKR